jgi:hypothetical protein
VVSSIPKSSNFFFILAKETANYTVPATIVVGIRTDITIDVSSNNKEGIRSNEYKIAAFMEGIYFSFTASSAICFSSLVNDIP